MTRYFNKTIKYVFLRNIFGFEGIVSFSLFYAKTVKTGSEFTLVRYSLDSKSELSSGSWASRLITYSVCANKLHCANKQRKVSFVTESFLLGL